MGHKVSAAPCQKRGTSAIRLPGATSIFNAELHAILLALDIVRRSKEKHFLLLLDSYSASPRLREMVCRLIVRLPSSEICQWRVDEVNTILQYLENTDPASNETSAASGINNT